MMAAFILLGCGSGSNTDATITTEDQNDQEITDIVSNDQDQRIIKEAVVETKPSNWYIRLVAEDPARAMKTGDTQLGALAVSDAVAKHTLKALSPFGGTYLDIVFRAPARVGSGDYKVNFHVYEEGNQDRWQFTVRTDDIDADILLTWRGLYVLTPYIDDQDRQRYKEYRSLTNPLIKNMKLIDVSTGNEISAAVDGKVQTYSFNMEGQTERTFEWVVETDEVTIPVEVSKLSTLQEKAIQNDAKVDIESSMGKKTESFDLTKPPMIKEDSFGK